MTECKLCNKEARKKKKGIDHVQGRQHRDKKRKRFNVLSSSLLELVLDPDPPEVLSSSLSSELLLLALKREEEVVIFTLELAD